ncbi:MAG: NUDIX hydrolase [Chloroflexota bacterium]|nr:NUDIX hydrolase [Chloroflexota bacterium]
MGEERVVESRQVYQGRIVSLRVDRVVLPSGRETTREVVEHGDCVAVVPLDGEGNVILVRQFRTPVGRELLELPAGGIEAGERPSQCARRELVEETGYRAQGMEPIGGFYASPGYCTEFLHLFLATGLEPGPGAAMEDEFIDVVPVPLSEVAGLIESGQVQDAKSVAGLLALLRRLERGGA